MSKPWGISAPVPQRALSLRWARHTAPVLSRAERENWRMPPLALFKPVTWSAGTKLAILVLRGYLAVSVVLLIIKAVELGSGH